MNVEKAVSTLREKEPVWFETNCYALRRNWLQLPINKQQSIIRMLKIPVVLPQRVDRYHSSMKAAYDEVFAYASAHDLLPKLVVAVETNS